LYEIKQFGYTLLKLEFKNMYRNQW